MFTVLATALVNLISEVTGGIRFVVIEEIVPASASHPAAGAVPGPGGRPDPCRRPGVDPVRRCDRAVPAGRAPAAGRPAPPLVHPPDVVARRRPVASALRGRTDHAPRGRLPSGLTAPGPCGWRPRPPHG